MSLYQAGPGNAKGAAPEWQDVAADADWWMMEADEAAKILHQVAECVSQIFIISYFSYWFARAVERIVAMKSRVPKRLQVANGDCGP